MKTYEKYGEIRIFSFSDEDYRYNIALYPEGCEVS